MKNKTKITLSCISATILAFGCLGGAVAQTAPFTLENGYRAASKGVIYIDEDAQFDSRDLGKIYDEVSTGRENVKTAITNNGGSVTPTGDGGFVTFQDLVTGVPTVKSSVWNDIKNNVGYFSADNDDGTSVSKKSSKRTNLYDSVNSVDTLAAAIAQDNVNYRNIIIKAYDYSTEETEKTH